MDEALGWLWQGEQGLSNQIQPAGRHDTESLTVRNESNGSAKPAARGRVLLADDNADMRAYIHRLLTPQFEVEAVSNGQEALDRAVKLLPT